MEIQQHGTGWALVALDHVQLAGFLGSAMHLCSWSVPVYSFKTMWEGDKYLPFHGICLGDERLYNEL